MQRAPAGRRGDRNLGTLQNCAAALFSMQNTDLAILQGMRLSDVFRAGRLNLGRRRRLDACWAVGYDGGCEL